MGVLDDAIREHLDLKRRRGADDAEIERAEAEALGPARRDAPAGGDDSEAGPGPPEPVRVHPVDDPAQPPAHDTEVSEPDADADDEPFR